MQSRVQTSAALILSLFIVQISAQENRIDVVRHDAPELAAFGGYDIGVRTLELTDPNRVDVLNTPRGEDSVYYDRNLVVEVWYPASLGGNQKPGGEYKVLTRNPDITATLHGKAVRDAEPHTYDAAYPLIIISHGYPGNRYLLSHTGESLASKGYVVVSIDHKDSTYEDQQAFPSTLYNRPLDQRFVLQAVADLAAKQANFLYQLVDADNTGVIGYSMGGYGLVNNLGGGYNDEMIDSFMAPANGLLGAHASGNPQYRENLDPRIKAGVAVAPWGMNSGFWTEADLAGISVPTFYIAGSNDTTAGYLNGPRAIYEGAVNSDRYLLTFKNAGHNAGAPYPLPVEIMQNEDQIGASHYTDPVWDTLRMNNIMDHFVTAYFDVQLKGVGDNISYLDLVPDSDDSVYSMDRDGPKDDHNYWKGFSEGSAVGLKLEHLTEGQ